MKNKLKTAFYLLALFNISACTAVTAERGSFLQDYQVEEVKVGESSRSDVLRLIGSPTTQSTFDNDIWYYIGQKTEKRGILDSKVVDERIIVVSFNDEGIVESIKEAAGDRVDIPYSRTKTPTHGNELTLTQQLLGNMGRFNTKQQ